MAKSTKSMKATKVNKSNAATRKALSNKVKAAATNAQKSAKSNAAKKNSSSTSKNTSSTDKKSTSSGYSTTALAKGALTDLQAAVKGLRINDLTSYSSKNSALGRQLREDFITDEKYIRDRMDAATRAAYDANRAAAVQDAISAEGANYANTRNAITELRRNLIGSGSSGANVGAANATALQALLGLGQSNAQTTTDSLRAINDVSRQRAATLAQNAVEAINTANDATSKMYDPATSSYGADHTYGVQGAAEAAGTLASAIDTAASQERQTSETNKTNASMNKYTADKGLEGTKYQSNKELEGNKYTADKNLQGTKYASDTNLKIEKTVKKTDNTNRNK